MMRRQGLTGTLIAVLALSLTLAACSGDNAANDLANHAGSGNAAVGNAAIEEPAPASDPGGTVSEAAIWQGEWKLEGANASRSSVITIQEPVGDRLAFSLDAFYLSDPDNENATPNIGNIANGEATIKDNTATFTDEDLGFSLTMALVDGKLTVVSTQGTGYFGNGVNVDGSYARAAGSE
jgi:hypothetical protein